MPTDHARVNEILAGCEGLLNDFSLPEEHASDDGRAVAHASSAKASSPEASPGQASTDAELSQSKRAWGRAIDRYVASVLEDGKDGDEGMDSPGAKSSKSNRSGTSRRSKKAHPDSHLLAALEMCDDTTVSSHRSIDADGRVIDECSFEPINPFGDGRDATFQGKGGGGSKTMRKIKQLLREEWKPISLIVLVIAAAIAVSATLGGGSPGGGSGGNPDLGVTTTGVGSGPSPTASPSSGPTDEVPTAYPTYLPTANPVVPATPAPTKNPAGEPTTDSPSPQPTPTPTVSPTSKPTPSPSANPTTSPTDKPSMPAAYHDMLVAAQYVSGTAPFESTSSAQSLAFHWLYYEGKPSNNLFEFFEQYAAAVVYFSLTRARTAWFYQNGDEDIGKFVETDEVCGWEGIRCAFNYTSEIVHVTEIRLSNQGLTGTIPEEIGFLPYLKRLDLSDNEIEGGVPESVYELTELRHLYLNNNNLVGSISPSIDKLNLAEEIYLGQNAFSGPLPATIGTNRPNNWRFFSVHDNQLSGQIPEAMKLKKAYMLDFSRNAFFGTIPSDIEHENYSTLRLLYMDHNLLKGTIPASLMQMRKMKGLFLNDNFLTGMVPYVIDDDQKSNLLTIRVQHNQLTTDIAPAICDLDVNLGNYELVELSVDCSVCPSDCALCTGQCYE